MSTLLVPPDDKCNEAYQQIAAIATAHALILEAAGGVMTIAIPEEQRKVEGLREKVLLMHCMIEIEDDGEEYSPSPVAQWPKRRPAPNAYKPKVQEADKVNLSAFEED